MSLAAPHEASEKTSAAARVMLGDVTNTAGGKSAGAGRRPLCGAQFSVRRDLVAAAAPLMAAAEQRKLQTPRTNEPTGQAAESGQKGGGVVAGGQCSNARRIALSAEKAVSPQKWMQRPLKFLRKYFFLKRLNALPSTPEDKKRSTSAQFRRLHVCASIKGGVASGRPPPPPPPTLTEGGEEHAARRFVRSRCFAAPTSRVLFAAKTSPTGDSGRSDGGGSGVSATAKVSISRYDSANLQACEGELSVLVGRQLGGNVDPPPLTGRETDGGSEAAAEAPPPNPTAGHQSHSHSRSAIGEAASQTDGVDLSTILPIGDEEVLVQLEGLTTPVRQPVLTLDEGKAAPTPEKGTTEKMCAELCTLGDVARDFTPQPSSLLERAGILTAGNINHAMMSFAVYHCRNLDESSHAFEGFLLRHFLEQFKVYETAVLEAAFVAGYTHMVAVPMMKLLEMGDRRVLCMKRDIYIRGLIERFVLEQPGTRRSKLPACLRPAARRRESRRRRPARQGEAPAIRQAGRSKSTRGERRQPGSDGYEVHIMGKGAGASRGAAAAASNLLPKTPPKPPRLHVFRAVQPVQRKRTPKRSPREEELMDIVKLVSS
ncbi:uncharacterized protein Tco025E_07587 [Trypanosoma conorhini]|uniref:Uncharacterized protein n=1 Tax=Trypanosoma conorhini TaxID=83891 RepID=A0A3R7MI73_9TRYP|nr:uncharacterized protein Tco025E_07587 [Trypanosoma conorhini]RNF06352.1 hypothetical protein Tco025E_07587 [Trypanosoma conorhini]